MQRQHRRSTQGVTKEHLEEASRIAMAENARRRALAATQSVTSNASSGSNSRETGIARLASEERDSTSMCSDRSSGSIDRGSPDESVSSRAGSAPPRGAKFCCIPPFHVISMKHRCLACMSHLIEQAHI
ncbi:hypothetical protein COOONC_07277 [Cooperia oncophora]